MYEMNRNPTDTCLDDSGPTTLRAENERLRMAEQAAQAAAGSGLLATTQAEEELLVARTERDEALSRVRAASVDGVAKMQDVVYQTCRREVGRILGEGAADLIDGKGSDGDEYAFTAAEVAQAIGMVGDALDEAKDNLRQSQEAFATALGLRDEEIARLKAERDAWIDWADEFEDLRESAERLHAWRAWSVSGVDGLIGDRTDDDLRLAANEAKDRQIAHFRSLVATARAQVAETAQIKAELDDANHFRLTRDDLRRRLRAYDAMDKVQVMGLEEEEAREAEALLRAHFDRIVWAGIPEEEDGPVPGFEQVNGHTFNAGQDGCIHHPCEVLRSEADTTPCPTEWAF